MVGLKRAPWLNATRSATLVGRLTAVAATCGCISGFCGSVTVQSLGAESVRVPCMMTWLSFVITALSLVNVHVHSASQSFPIDKRFVVPRAGNNSVRVASAGRLGRCKLAVCVELIVVPSGSWTMTGFVVGFLFLHGTLMPLKCPVAPVSATAMLVGGLRVGCSLWLRLLLAKLLR
jgi:hypothetical protein